ncbi:Gfo/Idh/MocA family oxidoreductase [Microbacterium panaciterrae]|uniref:Gfo/Idh/MocA family oxidoreductase n=1 Tax=Microbacterium panaciterrae TaxID=985759 RepID=A0ABP8PJY1_9MICO
MSSPRVYRAAIIGTGGIARAHADAVKALEPRIELVAVADVDLDRARAFGHEHGVPAAYADAVELFATEELDLVHICTPPGSHTSLALLAQRAGVPALVEKPTALSLREIDQLLHAEQETGVPVLTVFQHRFGPAARHLAALVDRGVLGRPLVATCETLWYRDDEYFAVPWRGRWDVEGGGPTMGHGIHQFDLLLAILGPWAVVSAFAGRQSRPTDTEDVSIALARFENGALATVVNSVVSPRETSRLRFDFEYATVEVEHLYGYTSADWTFTPAPGHQELAAQWRPQASQERSGHRDQLAAILDAFDGGTAPEVSLADARRTMEFAAATYASAFGGAPIRAGEIAGTDPFLQSMDGGMVPWPSLKEARV